jgi:HEPN domain-containing protein
MSLSPEEVNAWQAKTGSDLRSARILLKHDPPELWTACFHCQQAVEKALKTFLVSRGVSFEKVHSLAYLMDLCEAEEAGFSGFRDSAESLAGYAVEIRYPGGTPDISAKEASEALSAAESVVKYSLAYLKDNAESTPSEEE